ncbi:hypothetical protein HAN_1g111 (nucleomorph) [Hemiselmis andersenii]|uniref:Uncharacterized protein n=1 Tax=Hemiselmis andersenii TaxID=464988 RepID=A9BKB8_HEMAN|nr:hypothetical protein HAN_1g111 [Hemiselmis andersenii]ABW97951.1 hypothetical protein HAN_1g111 [Hemiselmis andersenii]
MKKLKEDSCEMCFLLSRKFFSCPIKKFFLEKSIRCILGFKDKHFYFRWIYQFLKDFSFLSKAGTKIKKKRKKGKLIKLIYKNFENKIELSKEKYFPIWKISDIRQENFWGMLLKLKIKKKKTLNELLSYYFFQGKKTFLELIIFFSKKKKNFFSIKKKKVFMLTALCTSVRFF